MRTLLHVLLAALWAATTTLFVAGLTYGQIPLLGAGSTKVIVSVPYQGPGDLVSGAVVWSGLRAYSVATKGTPAVNVCNVADVACADLSTDATSGALIIGTIGGSSCSVVTCTIKTWYDQSGNGRNQTQATIADRATLIVSCNNSLPCGRFSTVAAYTNATTGTINQPFTHVVAVFADGFSAYGMVLGNATTTGVGIFLSNTTSVNCYDGGDNKVSISVSTWYAVQQIANTASSDCVVNGASNTYSSAGTQRYTSGDAIGFGNDVTEKINGRVVEAGLWPVAFSGGNKTSMDINIRNYWGPF